MARVSITATTLIKSKTDVSDSVSEYTVTLDTQEVIVKSDLSLDDVKEKIAKTGKEVSMETIFREIFSYQSVFRFGLQRLSNRLRQRFGSRKSITYRLMLPCR